MKISTTTILLFTFVLFSLSGCKESSTETNKEPISTENQVRYATGFSIVKYDGYSLVTVVNPWPNATKNYTYILKESGGIIPDSLQNNIQISVPVKNIVVTSTTHIPSLELLEVENALIGFPNLDYISSEKVRSRIEAGKVTELGQNQDLNTEVIIDLNPDVLIGYGIDNKNPTLDNLEKSGIKIMLNGDWNEQTPLGKAEWIKFFGVLFGKEQKANSIFSTIEKEYKTTVDLVKNSSIKPSVLAGDIFEGTWYMPKGSSWGSQLIKEAGGAYLWKETVGTGSLALSFEVVFDRAKDADFWITSGQFSTLQEMKKANTHYSQFAAFKNKKVYSFRNKKGKTGGILYYELAPNRPDLVLKDLVSIFHPELVPNYKPFFFEQMK
ncbi:ABC transporter substrate-binding protein [Flavobacterium tegetincola]|uniref:ABC transporter substrate-binding protein n=1 Tax=Flavobacterium tegetincola TaxID=150172 RepID=UPI0004264DBA|nr:ABC transporter substrate-binding protein [Flavobacterium tegetincola]